MAVNEYERGGRRVGRLYATRSGSTFRFIRPLVTVSVCGENESRLEWSHEWANSSFIDVCVAVVDRMRGCVLAGESASGSDEVYVD